MSSIKTGLAARRAANENQITTPTAGLAPGHVQANLLMLPSQYAKDFRLLCLRNPVACPLLAESSKPGVYDSVKSRVPWLEDDDVLAHGCDLRADAPKYNVYRDGALDRESVPDVKAEWGPDHVAFLIGCSFSFEAALGKAALEPRHTKQSRNVPMYRTRTKLFPSGVFYDSCMVVSMRAYPASDIGRVREATSPYWLTHGEPVDWGWGAVDRLGIASIDKPEWGDAPSTEDGRPLGEVAWKDGDVPVFWGCGVTTQEAIMKAEIPGVVMAHSPGHMIVLDCKDEDIVRT